MIVGTVSTDVVIISISRSCLRSLPDDNTKLRDVDVLLRCCCFCCYISSFIPLYTNVSWQPQKFYVHPY
ncbi:unnamed protein product [Acanthoscelides obtectus]|uniref:Uncharacterized protein n=1 Tax=Acanthoscelides obtectus TaxID=200917 RepID=A0A9P0KJ42_ACAOB|nr:unnamed protein product [Acanthoscelides obtectus]CAH2011705.1 unnamed protein product [Acanthoscelides obtectus]CAK1656439.1 hypothetical protein AOBTE_LOCUS19711 [Acanthoscelides obtectus]CAK1656443.1 hypothetical protein AOBTE_LOCUS19713 [Acanthoscelides obtectus]